MTFEVNRITTTNPTDPTRTTTTGNTRKVDGELASLIARGGNRFETPQITKEEMTELLKPDADLYNNAPQRILATDFEVPSEIEYIKKDKSPADVATWAAANGYEYSLRGDGSYILSKDGKTGTYSPNGELLSSPIPTDNNPYAVCHVVRDKEGNLTGYRLVLSDLDGEKHTVTYDNQGNLAYVTVEVNVLGGKGCENYEKKGDNWVVKEN